MFQIPIDGAKIHIGKLGPQLLGEDSLILIYQNLMAGTRVERTDRE
jgi:hypothetical protein